MARVEDLRQRMVDSQIAARGVKDGRVLEALRRVPREAFLSKDLLEFAYADTPLPIASGQTISQPYIVALMVEMLGLPEGARVLEVGTGSGYAAAVLGEVAAEVYTIERYPDLARTASATLAHLGYHNVHVRRGDGTRGWLEAAPFDGIVVTAGGPRVPESLRRQLAIGGRLVIPVGRTPEEQTLLRVTRVGPEEWSEEDLGGVRFVPLVGEEGWASPESTNRPPVQRRETLAQQVARAAEPFEDIEDADLDAFLDRVGDARVVLLGEATHGTAEFYRMRARITRALVEQKGFDVLALEADWPDAARIDHHVRTRAGPPAAWRAFARFPTLMWRNREFADLVAWLEHHNRSARRPVGVYGLDLYSLHTSIERVLAHLDEVDPATARVARERYGCLTPWEQDPAAYGRMALTGRYRSCEDEVVAMLTDLLSRRLEGLDPEERLDARQNARVVANAEAYYRAMYYGSVASWNLRDRHMFDTLEAVLQSRGPESRAVVWAHNSHLGDARATQMGASGEHNLGQLARQRFGDGARLVGFGTHRGTVAAATDWGGPMEVKEVRPSHERSYERVCHDTGTARFILGLRPGGHRLREALEEPRLQRAIGVIYRPETELRSHYFEAILAEQFDEWIWFDETTAVTPLAVEEVTEEDLPETWPFGL